MYYDLLNGLSYIADLKIEVNKEEQLINIYYPKTYDVNIGILPCVRLEIGPLAAWTPAEFMNINPYISNIIPNFNVIGTTVRTVSIGRTFWEKITILHREANRPENKKMPKRYARHYYDVYQIFHLCFLMLEINVEYALRRKTEGMIQHKRIREYQAQNNIKQLLMQ